MKQKDLGLIAFFVLLFLPFFLFDSLFNFYISFNRAHGIIMAFVKFSILATLGEIIGTRIRTGNYFNKGFGILPRAVYWGFYGITIKIAFIIFISGVPTFLDYCGLHGASGLMAEPLQWKKVLLTFSISTSLNLIYAPVLMTFHKITDTHIIQHNGAFSCLFKPLKMKHIITHLDWETQWNFIFKKTIPLFWIPAHTITFLLPKDMQILFAALLGIVLGTLLAVASKKKQTV